jgi:hypothetical protein
MGQLISKRQSPKINKNHHRQKMFRIGISFGRNDLNLEGHLQMDYNSKTVKNYAPIENMHALKSIESKTVDTVHVDTVHVDNESAENVEG